MYITISLILVAFISLAACGPNETQRNARASEVVANIFASQTFDAPTATQTKAIPNSTITPIPSTFTPTIIPPTASHTPEQRVENEYMDDRIGVVVTGVKKAHSLPANYSLPRASENNTYITVNFVITRIKGIHLIDPGGFEKDHSIILDDTGQSYTLLLGTFSGVMLSDPTDFANSSYEFIEGAEGVLVYEIPDDREPASLFLIYTYQESLDEGSAKKRGEMEIRFDR